MPSDQDFLHSYCFGLRKLFAVLFLAATASACAGIKPDASAPISKIPQDASASPHAKTAASPPPSASSPYPAFGDPAFDDDPLEPLNRFFYGVNFVVDHTLLRPLALAYRAGVPDGMQKGVRNVLRNLKNPIVILNDALQGNWDDAGRTTLRLAVNSTVGFFGLFDVAADEGIPHHSNGFGQTLAVYGVGRGPYLFLPLRGPTNPRDAIGLGVDSAVDPLSLYLSATDYASLSWVRSGASGFQEIVEVTPLLQDVEQTALDPYSMIRRFYLYGQQYRDAQIDADRGRNAPTSAPPPPPVRTEDVSGSEFDF